MLKINFRIAILITVFFSSCFDKADDSYIAVDNEVLEFVWGGLNSWYFWQSEIPELSDKGFTSVVDRNSFINAFSGPQDLFEALQHPEDRFSWIVDDYMELINSFQGVTKSSGFEFGLVHYQGQLFGYVEYVLPDSPADQAGLKRGDIFNEVDGTELTTDNYVPLLFGSEQFTLSLVNITDDQVIPLDDQVSITKVVLAENPILLSTVISYDDKKVGYLIYNQFINSYHGELNEVFSAFSSAGIDELVIDLRYNPGGFVETSALLASMIYGSANSNAIFSNLTYNSKHSEFNGVWKFTEVVQITDQSGPTSTEPMNRLTLDRVYVLTGTGTASASELLINGLEPYMEVRQIGSVTRGKNEGSITLYDAPLSDYTNREIANPSHRWAMQPIVFRLTNSEGFGDYADGLIPDIEIDEYQYFTNLKPLGDPEEILLKTALEDMVGGGTTGRTGRTGPEVELIQESRVYGKFRDDMIIGQDALRMLRN